MALTGSVTVKTLTIDGHVEYDGRDGADRVSLGGSFTRDWGPVSASLGVSGGIAAHPFHFELTGHGSITAFGATSTARRAVFHTGVSYRPR